VAIAGLLSLLGGSVSGAVAASTPLVQLPNAAQKLTAYDGYVVFGQYEASAQQIQELERRLGLVSGVSAGELLGDFGKLVELFATDGVASLAVGEQIFRWYASVGADLVVGNGSLVEQLDQMRAGDLENVSGLLGREILVVWHDGDGLSARHALHYALQRLKRRLRYLRRVAVGVDESGGAVPAQDLVDLAAQLLECLLFLGRGAKEALGEMRKDAGHFDDHHIIQPKQTQRVERLVKDAQSLDAEETLEARRRDRLWRTGHR
jgi:hypothetical protein